MKTHSVISVITLVVGVTLARVTNPTVRPAGADRWGPGWARGGALVAFLSILVLAPGCSIKKFAINKIGDTLASGNSVYESDEDLELVAGALPFGLKLVESLLAESPDHRGLLLTACRGFVLYSYAYVDYEAQLAEETDLERARHLRNRARRLYLRGFRYGLQGLERSYKGFEDRLTADPWVAVASIKEKKKKRDLPFLYWSAAALGLAISASRHDAAMLARLPEVEAMLDRALELDESWDGGALHAFQIQLASAKVEEADTGAIARHYRRAMELSQGNNADLHLAYAEAVSIPAQDREEFCSLVQKALAVDPDHYPESRLLVLLAHRRAHWLMERVDDLILGAESCSAASGGNQ